MMYVKNGLSDNLAKSSWRSFLSASTLVLAFALMVPGAAKAEDLYLKAEKQMQSGDIRGMAATYRNILGENPSDVRARLGYATALSWQGQHGEAQPQFKEVLRKQPENLDALTGLGYSYAWAEQYFDAEMQFNKALQIAPDNVGAQKGLAFTYLWSGQADKAAQHFSALNDANPGDAEILSALGQAQFAQGDDAAAQQSFNQALQIDPAREDAINGLAAIEQKSAPQAAAQPNQRENYIDLSISYGDTSDGDSGLREVFAGYQVNERSRLWVRYDDSLSLDNPALARSGEDAETFYLGLQNRVNDAWLAVFEIGERDLPDNADQQIYKIEGVNFRQQDDTLKLGFQLSPHSDDYTDKLLWAGYGFPLNDAWRLEPTLYLSTSGAIDDEEWRAVLFAEYQSSQRWSVGLGAGVGQISSDLAAADGDVSTANARLTYPINQTIRVNLSARYEDTPTNSFSTTLIGIAVQLP